MWVAGILIVDILFSKEMIDDAPCLLIQPTTQRHFVRRFYLGVGELLFCRFLFQIPIGVGSTESVAFILLGHTIPVAVK